jgi:hypothetical protein
VEIKDRDGNPMTIEQIKKEGKAIERAINNELEKENNPHTKESQTEKIYDPNGIIVKHNGKEYNMDDYVHIKMEWAYFQGQTEAMSGDVRVVKQDGCWTWKSSPWDGQSLNTVLYKPECGDVDVSSYDKVTEEINFDETYDPYDTDY